MADLADQIDDYICTFEGVGDLTMDTLAMLIFVWAVAALFLVWLAKFVYTKYVRRSSDAASGGADTSKIGTSPSEKLGRRSEPKELSASKDIKVSGQLVVGSCLLFQMHVCVITSLIPNPGIGFGRQAPQQSGRQQCLKGGGSARWSRTRLYGEHDDAQAVVAQEPRTGAAQTAPIASAARECGRTRNGTELGKPQFVFNVGGLTRFISL